MTVRTPNGFIAATAEPSGRASVAIHRNRQAKASRRGSRIGPETELGLVVPAITPTSERIKQAGLRSWEEPGLRSPIIHTSV
jgi:hypothetical protein